MRLRPIWQTLQTLGLIEQTRLGGLLVGVAGATFAGLGSVGELRHRSSSAIRLEEDKAAAELAERAQLQHEDSLATSPSLAHSDTLRFVSVALVDKTYWSEVRRGENDVGVFNRCPPQYFHIDFAKGFVFDPLLIFDVTIMNRSVSYPRIVREVGVRWTALLNENIAYGVPEAAKITRGGEYSITCHEEKFTAIELRREDEWEALDDISALELAMFEPAPIDVAIDEGLVLPDPIYLEPQAPFRFSLELKRYTEVVPNHALIRFWVRSEVGLDWSQEIEIFTL